MQELWDYTPANGEDDQCGTSPGDAYWLGWG